MKDNEKKDPDGEYFDDDFFDDEPEESAVIVGKKRRSKPAKEPDPRESDVGLTTRDVDVPIQPEQAAKRTKAVSTRDLKEK